MTAQAIVPHCALPHHRRRSSGRRRSLAPRFGAENTFTDVVDITCDISDFRAQIFCPKMTQKLPKKHHEAGPPEKLHTDALSQSIYGLTLDIVKIVKRFACANEQRKGYFG